MTETTIASRPIPGLAPTATRTITFDAPGEARTGPLTWAQQHMLALIEELAPRTESVNLSFFCALRSGVREAEVLDALRNLVETYEALRTVYLPPPDGPAQRVARSGELAVPVIEAPAGTAATTASQVAKVMWAEPFDITGEWPMRVALVTSGGQPRHLAFTLCHLVVDQTGADRIQDHLRPLLARPPAPAGKPAVIHQPLDEAAWESSPAGRRHGERAVRHHARTFAAMPQTMLPRAAVEVPSPRYHFLQYDSAALALAVAWLAARHGVGPAAVLSAGLCAVAGYAASLDRAFVQMTVGNRIAERTRHAVGMHTQDVPVFLDLSDAAMSDIIVRANTAILQAARFGQYPPAELAARRREIEIERGVALDLSCWLNYRLVGHRRPLSPDPPSRAALAEAEKATRWRWNDGVDSSTSTYFVFADDAGDMIRFTLLVDTAVLPPDEAVAWLRSVERLLSATATGDVAVEEVGAYTDLTPVPRGADWLLTEGGWAHLPTVTDLVRRISGARHCAVFPDGSPPNRLVAYLHAPTITDLTRLHISCVDALPGLRTAIAPHRYVICPTPPPTPDLEAWRTLPILTEGTGRPA